MLKSFFINHLLFFFLFDCLLAPLSPFVCFTFLQPSKPTNFNHITDNTSSFCNLARTGLPSVGEAVPQALAVTPQQPVKDAVKEPVQVEAFQVLLPPDALQRRVHIGPHNIQHLSDGERQRGDVGGIKKKQEV